jgi:hypothetical protein
MDDDHHGGGALMETVLHLSALEQLRTNLENLTSRVAIPPEPKVWWP